MPHRIRNMLETSSVKVLGLPLLHVALFFLERLLVPINAHSSPVGYFLFVNRFFVGEMGVELFFSFIHSTVKRELVNEGLMDSIYLLLVSEMESSHLDGSNLLISQLGRLDSASIHWRLYQSERFI